MSDKGAQNPIDGRPMWEDYADGVQRIAIPEGWLYRTLLTVTDLAGYERQNWSGPVFVPDPDEDGAWPAHLGHVVQAIENLDVTLENILNAVKGHEW